jgi:hypothetical protein
MQVNATLIAAQQAAREAQARFQTAHLAPKPAPATDFVAALEKDLFEPLPLKQIAAVQAAPQGTSAANPSPASRPGSLLDIRI